METASSRAVGWDEVPLDAMRRKSDRMGACFFYGFLITSTLSPCGRFPGPLPVELALMDHLEQLTMRRHRFKGKEQASLQRLRFPDGSFILFPIRSQPPAFFCLNFSLFSQEMGAFFLKAKARGI